MELGSEYNLDLSQLNIVENNLFNYLKEYNCIYTDSGRSALKIVAKNINGEILVPEFICETVIDCFKDKKIVYYNILEDGTIDIVDLKQKISIQTSSIFIMHYFGTLQPKDILLEIREIANKNSCIIIEDTTHSLFSRKSTIGDYMISSVRKWMPIAQGGVIYSKKSLPTKETYSNSTDNYRNVAMILKNMYINEGIDFNEIYRKIFVECEKKMDNKNQVELMSDLSNFIISCMDVEVIIRRRQENYKYLLKKLDKFGLKPICCLKSNECPFVFPIRLMERDRIRKYLINNKVYCAVHWPYYNDGNKERYMAKINSETLISLPIDQRYQKKEMDYMIKCLEEAKEGLLF